MNERRQGQHSAVKNLVKVYSDLQFAEAEVAGLEDTERRHRSLCFIRASIVAIRHIVDENLGPRLIKPEGEI